MPLGVQHVSIDRISGTKYELDFIKFLLLYSPVLEKMTVKLKSSTANVRTEVMTELIRFKRASSQDKLKSSTVGKGKTLPKVFHFPQ
jgi:hypothetical protein